MQKDQSTPTTFNQEIEEYLKLNGFKRIPNLMLFERKNCWLKFRGDVIEWIQPMRTYSMLAARDEVKSYKGFDGQNMFHLMMLLDIMGAIKIKDVVKKISEPETTADVLSQVKEIYNVHAVKMNALWQ